MRKVATYERIIKKVKGKWRYVYKAVYIDKGKASGIEKAKRGKSDLKLEMV